MGGIEVKDLVFTYPGTSSETLRGVDLSVGEGEFLSLIGPSGCGKSTLLRLLAGLERPESGSLFCGGVPITGPGSDRGVVFQSPALFPWMTARDNVSFAIRKSEHSLSGAEARSRAEEALCRVGLADSMSMLPNQLSGGMQQRVQIAKALSNNPPVLLLDEVTTGLDLSVQANVLDLIKQIQRESGVSMIVVSHDLAVIRMLADRTIVMLEGQIIEQGLTDQIMEDPQHPYTQQLVYSLL